MTIPTWPWLRSAWAAPKSDRSLLPRWRSLASFQAKTPIRLGRWPVRSESSLVTKPTKRHLRPAKTQMSLGICPVWSESSLCAQCVAKDPSFFQADNEDSDQTGRMPRLIWVFAGCTYILLVVSYLVQMWITKTVLVKWMYRKNPKNSRHPKKVL